MYRFEAILWRMPLMILYGPYRRPMHMMFANNSPHWKKFEGDMSQLRLGQYILKTSNVLFQHYFFVILTTSITSIVVNNTFAIHLLSFLNRVSKKLILSGIQISIRKCPDIFLWWKYLFLGKKYAKSMKNYEIFKIFKLLQEIYPVS